MPGVNESERVTISGSGCLRLASSHDLKYLITNYAIMTDVIV